MLKKRRTQWAILNATLHQCRVQKIIKCLHFLSLGALTGQQIFLGNAHPVLEGSRAAVGGCVAVGQQPDQYRRERLLGCSDTQQSQMSSCAQWGKKPGRNIGSQPLPKPSAWRECIYFQGYPWCSEATHLWTLFFISIYNVGKMRWKMK